ncbi:50S ribosomal protein L25/general stress protein Ctc [Tessaracoccus sp. SD287]|uniref:50S ribosomal protein L25/general stress protein Ctc n=1 Tax=Tessaracoccus sp. SD287 TaxID=2782008 RepID=UPI001A97873D|nr:50S ribosomal protein L25/general stress protein Ctc [Tessaracoccus sp. SD287]MBO1031073.1 50S ribosomal protein L25/general stress protein Ctc [Tessaracoccus sp. SD287]
MAEITLVAESRSEFGKGAARRLRRAGQVPAVLYGHGTDPVHIALPGHATLLALRQANALLSIEVPGEAAQLALPKQVQRDPIRGFIEHVDLLLVRRGEKVSVEVAIVTTGEATPNTMVSIEHSTITVLAPATSIPSEIEVSIEGAEVGTQILLGDLQLPENVEIAGDPEALVVNITNAPSQAQLDAEMAEAEAEAGIEHEAPAAAEEA